MANIIFISDNFQPTGGGGGETEPGGANLGTVDWLEPKIFTETFGLLGGSSIWEGEVRNMLLSPAEQQIIWPRNTDYYFYQQDLLYEVTDQAYQSLAKAYASTALSPFSIGSQSGAARLWRSGSTRRLLIPGGGNYPGNNPLMLASVDLASGQLHTGFTKAQITSNLGLPSDALVNPAPVVSPDGTKVVMSINPAASGFSTQRLCRIGLNSSDQFSSIESLIEVSQTLTIAASNSAFYTINTPSSGSSELQRRSYTTGEVTHTIAAPGGWWSLNGWWNNAKVTGSSLFIFGATQQNKLRLWKISLSSNEVVGAWDLSGAPQSSFNSYLNAPFGSPETAWDAPSVMGAGFDSSANLWVAFNNDISLTTNSIGDTRYSRDRRVYRVKLS